MYFTVKQAREYAGFSQCEMAKKLGVHRTTYIKIEKDATRATVRQINQISEATNIPVSKFFLADVSTKVG